MAEAAAAAARLLHAPARLLRGSIDRMQVGTASFPALQRCWNRVQGLRSRCVKRSGLEVPNAAAVPPRKCAAVGARPSALPCCARTRSVADSCVMCALLQAAAGQAAPACGAASAAGATPGAASAAPSDSVATLSVAESEPEPWDAASPPAQGSGGGDDACRGDSGDACGPGHQRQGSGAAAEEEGTRFLRLVKQSAAEARRGIC